MARQLVDVRQVCAPLYTLAAAIEYCMLIWQLLHKEIQD